LQPVIFAQSFFRQQGLTQTAIRQPVKDGKNGCDPAKSDRF